MHNELKKHIVCYYLAPRQMCYLSVGMICAVNFKQHMIKDHVWLCALLPFRFWLVCPCQTVVVCVIRQEKLILHAAQIYILLHFKGARWN